MSAPMASSQIRVRCSVGASTGDARAPVPKAPSASKTAPAVAGHQQKQVALSRRASMAAAAAAAVSLTFSRIDSPALAAEPPREDLKRQIDQEIEQLRQLRAAREATAQRSLDELIKKGEDDSRMLAELRARREAEAKAQLEELRILSEAEARESRASLLCATPFGIDVVGITQTVGLIGAVVGGTSARNRKAEMEELNAKLRSVNKVLREQARSSPGISYAPGLSYAPPNPPTPPPQPVVQDSVEEPVDQTRMALREGKKLLREDMRPGPAMVQFKKGLMLARANGERVLERRAIRGLAAAKRIQGDVRGSISDYMEVLEISKAIGEYTGDADALGNIADLYTELGDLEEAGKFYDKYLRQLSQDDEQGISPSA